MGYERLIKSVKIHKHPHTGGWGLNHLNTANQCDSNKLRAADPISPLLFLCALLGNEMALNAKIFLQINGAFPQIST